MICSAEDDEAKEEKSLCAKISMGREGGVGGGGGGGGGTTVPHCSAAAALQTQLTGGGTAVLPPPPPAKNLTVFLFWPFADYK